MPARVVVPNSCHRALVTASLCMNTRCVLQEILPKMTRYSSLLYFSHVEKFSYCSKHALYFINYLCFSLTFHHVRLTNNSRLSLRSTDWKYQLEISLEPRFNEPLYNEVLGITNDIFQPSNSVMYGKEPLYNLFLFSALIYNKILKLSGDVTRKNT